MTRKALRWPKKREFLAYYLLYKEYRTTCNLGEALDTLRKQFRMPKKIAMNIIKRLKMIGYIEIKVKEDSIVVTLRPLEKLLDDYLNRYIQHRQAHVSSDS